MAGRKQGVLMSPASASLYAIDLGAERPSKLPSGCRFIGSLHSNALGSGSLVQVINSGIYALVIEGSIHYLSQLDVEQALRKLLPPEELLETEVSLGFAKPEGLLGDISID